MKHKYTLLLPMMKKNVGCGGISMTKLSLGTQLWSIDPILFNVLSTCREIAFRSPTTINGTLSSGSSSVRNFVN